MKKFLLFVAGLCGMVSTALATWQEDLVNLNKGLIDSVIPANPAEDTFPNLKSYTVYYHQPILHADSTSEQFPLRAHLIVRTDKAIATAGLLVNIGGYEINDNPTSYASEMTDYPNNSIIELATRYNLHMLVPEHRYFRFSSPTLPWTKAEGIKAVEAAEDFHVLINAVKKVFTSGRYMIAGVSKGGITTAMQGLFYPEDAHFYVPYAAPFCDSIVDPRQGQYMQSHGWTEALRKRMHDLQSEAIVSDDAISWAIDYFEKKDTARYFDCVGQFEMGHHANNHRKDVVAYLDRFNVVSDSLAELGRGVRGQHLGYIMCYADNNEISYTARLDSMIKEFSDYRGPKRLASVPPITVDSGCVTNAYYYQAYTELGTYEIDPIVFVPKEKKAWAQAIWDKRDLLDSIFKPLKYSSELRNTVMAKMGTFQGTMVFLYGEDDHWTGAAMEDKYINNSTTYKYILPENNHSDGISRLYEEQFGGKYKALADEIWAILDKEIPSQLFNTIETPTIECKKIMKGGQIIILRDGKMYNTLGQEL